MRLDPVWRKAPVVLLRFPQILVAVALGALLLGIASSAGPAFLSSSAGASLTEEIARAGRYGVGLRIARSEAFWRRDSHGRSVARMTSVRSRLLDRELERFPHVGDRILTLMGSFVTIGRVGEHTPADTRLVARTDALQHVALRSRSDAEGVFVADVTAEELGIDAGDSVELRLGGRLVTVAVAGIYKALALDRPRPYWSPLGDVVHRSSPSDDTLPPPLTIVPSGLFYDITARLYDEGLVRWDYPLAPGPLSLAEATTTADRLSRVHADVNNYRTDLGTAFLGTGGGGVLRPQPLVLHGLVQTATERIQSLREPVELLSLATRVVALTVCGAAGFYLVQRRRVEWVLLASRGRGPVHLGAKAASEALLPLAVGAGAGSALGALLVARLGPSRAISPAATSQAASTTIITIGLALLVLTAVVAATIAREEALLQERIALLRRMWWEAPVLALAGLALVHLATSEGALTRSAGVPTLDRAVVFLPLLLILAGAGLLTRALRVLLGRMDAVAGERSPPIFLALRRLSRSPRLVLVLLTACAFSLGVLLFAGSLASSVESTAAAKAMVFAGSDWSAPIPMNSESPRRFPFPATRVIKVNQATAQPGDVSVALMGVDVDTFARAAFWDPAFSDRSLHELLGALGADDDRLDVLLAGEQRPRVDALSAAGKELPVEVVATVEAFPGVTSDRPLLVSTDHALEEALASIGGSISGRTEELWVRGEPDRIAAASRAAGFLTGVPTIAEEVIRTPALLSLLWTLRLLQLLAAGAGAVALVGLLLYLQARQRGVVLARALTRRMGMTREGQLLSGWIELTGMLLMSFVVGSGVALAVAAATHRRFDLRPSLLPDPLLRMPIGLAVATALAVAVAGSVSAVWMARSADRSNVAEVLRAAE